MWLFLPKSKVEKMRSTIAALEEDVEFKQQEMVDLKEDLDMAEACLQNLRDNKVDALVCQSLFRSLRAAVELALSDHEKDFPEQEKTFTESEHLFEGSHDILRQIDAELKSVSERAYKTQSSMDALSRDSQQLDRTLDKVKRFMGSAKKLSEQIDTICEASENTIEDNTIASTRLGIRLAQKQFSEASKDIYTLLNKIAGEVNEAQSQIADIIDISASIGLTTGAVDETTEELVSFSKKYRERVEQHEISDIIRRAQWEHVAIKSKLCEKILSFEPSDEPFEHRACFFYHWLSDEQNLAQIETLPNYQAVNEAHQHYHLKLDLLSTLEQFNSTEELLNYIFELDKAYEDFVVELGVMKNSLTQT